MLIGRLAVERALQKRRHSRRHHVLIEVARFRLLEWAPGTESKTKKNEILAHWSRGRGRVGGGSWQRPLASRLCAMTASADTLPRAYNKVRYDMYDG